MAKVLREVKQLRWLVIDILSLTTDDRRRQKLIATEAAIADIERDVEKIISLYQFIT